MTPPSKMPGTLLGFSEENVATKMLTKKAEIEVAGKDGRRPNMHESKSLQEKGRENKWNKFVHKSLDHKLKSLLSSYGINFGRNL